MKKLVCLMFFSMFFCFESIAQKTQNEQILSNKTTMKGRRELRREKKVHHKMEMLASKNERSARREHDLGTVSHHDKKAKKMAKDRKNAKLKNEKIQAKKDKEEKSKSESVADSNG